MTETQNIVICEGSHQNFFLEEINRKGEGFFCSQKELLGVKENVDV